MSHTALQIYEIVIGSVRNVSVDVSGMLDDGELLTGVPTVDEITTSDLTISNKAVNISTLNILGNDVLAGKAVQFSVDATNAVDEVIYNILITASTDSTPAQTLPFKIQIKGESP